jgi:uncharacterized membrane protein YfcA
MAWPLAWNIIIGTVPGLFMGGVIRIIYLPDPKAFKVFAGCVLVYIGARMLQQVIRQPGAGEKAVAVAEAKMRQQAMKSDHAGADAASNLAAMRTISWSVSRTEYEFYGERFSFHTTGLFVLSLIVGLVGGVYGIGGGAIIAPFIVTYFGLPIHTIAGATLMGTCVTSVGGVLFFWLIGPYFASSGENVSPDWLLGFLFGIGGLVGMYLGASVQKYVPGRIIRPCLAILLTGLGIRYILGNVF